jgi:hypothetical protein
MKKARRVGDLLQLLTLLALPTALGCTDRGTLDPPQRLDVSGASRADETGAAGDPAGPANGTAGTTVGPGGGTVGAGGAGGQAWDPSSPETNKCPCSWGRPGPNRGWWCAVGSGAAVSKVIGPEGGVLSMTTGTEGVTLELEIPPGALSAPTKVDINESPFTVPPEYTAYSLLYRIDPAGLALAVPARLRLPWDVRAVPGVAFEINPALSVYLSPSTSPPSTYALDPKPTFERLPDSYVNAGFSQATLDRLGFVFAGYPRTLDPSFCDEN